MDDNRATVHTEQNQMLITKTDCFSQTPREADEPLLSHLRKMI